MAPDYISYYTYILLHLSWEDQICSKQQPESRRALSTIWAMYDVLHGFLFSLPYQLYDAMHNG